MRSGPWLIFEVAGRSLALPLEVVAEVSTAVPPRLIPMVPREVGGVVNFRGEPLPAIDAAALVGPSLRCEHRHLIVVVRGGVRLGVLVSAVERIDQALEGATELDEGPSGELDGLADWVLSDGSPLGLLRPDPLMSWARYLLTQGREGGSIPCHDAF